MSNGQGTADAAGRPNIISLSAELMRGGRVIPTAAQIAFTGEDTINVQSYANLTGTILMRARFLDAVSGQIIPHSISFPMQAFITQQTLFQPGRGYLLGASFYAVGLNGNLVGAPPFVQVFITRGQVSAAAITLDLIAAGYGGNQVPVAWPNQSIVQSSDGAGYSQWHTGTTPAAGAEILEQVPGFTEWRTTAFRFTLTTSAAAGQRAVLLRLRSQDLVELITTHATGTQAPATTQTYNFFIGAGVSSTVVGGNIIGAFPTNVRLHQLDTIGTQTVGLQGGDQFTNVFYYNNEYRDVT